MAPNPRPGLGFAPIGMGLNLLYVFGTFSLAGYCTNILLDYESSYLCWDPMYIEATRARQGLAWALKELHTYKNETVLNVYTSEILLFTSNY